MDTSSSDDEAAGQASVSTDINGILRTDTLSSEDEQETSSDACSTAASRVTSAPVSPTTPELQATNDRPQHANPMVSHDTLLNDEELSMSDEDGSEQHDPGELPSEDDMVGPSEVAKITQTWLMSLTAGGSLSLFRHWKCRIYER